MKKYYIYILTAVLPILWGACNNGDDIDTKHTEEYQTPNAVMMIHRSQTARDKLGSQKGKSPDLQLRSQSAC